MCAGAIACRGGRAAPRRRRPPSARAPGEDEADRVGAERAWARPCPSASLFETPARSVWPRRAASLPARAPDRDRAAAGAAPRSSRPRPGPRPRPSAAVPPASRPPRAGTGRAPSSSSTARSRSPARSRGQRRAMLRSAADDGRGGRGRRGAAARACFSARRTAGSSPGQGKPCWRWR